MNLWFAELLTVNITSWCLDCRQLCSQLQVWGWRLWRCRELKKAAGDSVFPAEQITPICSLPEASAEKYLMLNKQDLRFFSLSHVAEYRQSIRLKSRIRWDLKGNSPGASGQCWCLEVWDSGGGYVPVDFSLNPQWNHGGYCSQSVCRNTSQGHRIHLSQK